MAGAAAIRRRFAAALVLALLALGLVLPQAGAEVYKWQDAQGVLHFSDKPPAEGQAEQVVVRPANSFRGMPVEPAPEATPPAKPSGKGKSVVMYSADWCGYCRKARSYFQANGVSFRERDVDKDPAARAEYERLGGSGLPLILVGGKRLNGFSEASFRSLYER